MPYLKRYKAGLTTADPTVLGQVGLGARYGKIKGFKAILWSSAAKTAKSADATSIIELKDADGQIFYLDSVGQAYNAATPVPRLIAYDDLNTGLGWLPVTAIGAAWVAAEGQAIEPPIVKGPITITVRGAGTATDFMEVELYVEV